MQVYDEIAERGQAGVNNSVLASVDIPLPPLAIQRQIVAEIEAERALVDVNRKLAEIWGGHDEN